ncbi:hypothetical protein ACHAWF_001033 [Thalassiosira exigua]
MKTSVLAAAGVVVAAPPAGASVTLYINNKQVNFSQNSKQMYDAVLKGIPPLFRRKAQKNMDRTIADICEEVVTESDMYEVVRRTTPKLYLRKGINVLDKHATSLAP